MYQTMEPRMLPFSEACERNKGPILELLRPLLADRAQVLEIGSGTGQHAVHFAAHLAHVGWQPTERLAGLPGLAERIRSEGSPNLHRPALLDVRQSVWPVRTVDAVFSANTLHIMAWAEVVAMFQGIGAVLAPGGIFCVYGPFIRAGQQTSPSNQEFDLMLRERDPESGIRDIDAVKNVAAGVGMRLAGDHPLPACNRLLVFLKEPA